MKVLFRLCVLIAVSLVSLRAAEDKMAAIRAADDARIAALLSADRSQLEAIFSDELRYVHSSGTIDTKQTFIESLVSKRTRYLSFEGSERHVAPIADDVALVSGRSNVQVLSNHQPLDLFLSYLAVYRRENGRWRFVAWQSARLPAPANAPAAAK